MLFCIYSYEEAAETDITNCATSSSYYCAFSSIQDLVKLVLIMADITVRRCNDQSFAGCRKFQFELEWNSNQMIEIGIK